MKSHRPANRLSFLWITLLLLLLSWPLEADAQDFHGSASPHREGLLMGASFGRGSIDVECPDCGDLPSIREALSVAAHVGYMLTPSLALIGEHWSVRYNARGGAWFDDSAEHLVAHHISAAAAQVFVTNSLWLKAGFGIGWHITDGDYAREATQPSRAAMTAFKVSSTPSPEKSSSDLSPASFAALGWEFAHNSAFAAEIQFRVGATRRPDDLYQVYNTAFNVGCSWY